MNTEEQIKALAGAQRAKTLTDLQAKRDASLSPLKAEEAQIKPAYQQQRQTTNAQSQLGAKNFKEYLANRGLSSSGISAQAEISRGNTLANNINTINTNESNAVNDINRRMTDVGNAYNSDVASANSAIDIELGQNLINYRQAEQERQDRLKQQAFDNSMAIKNYNLRRETDNTGEINSYKGLTIPYQQGVKGVPNGNKMIYSLPQADGSISQLELDKGVNPFTGNINPDAKKIDKVTKKETWSVFDNGYQPNNVKGNKLSKSGVMTTVNGQNQNVWKTTVKGNNGNWLGQGKTSDKTIYYIWDGANNKYWELTAQERKALGLK